MPHVHNGLHHYTQLLTAAARAVGEVSGSQDFTGIERFGETLTPIINIWELPEWALLRGEILFSRITEVAAGGAGVWSTVELVNPAGSGVLAVVLELVNNGVGLRTNVDNGPGLGAVATARGVANDTRYEQIGEVSQCTLVSGNLAGGVALPQDAIPQTVASRRPYILRPGRRLVVDAGIDNRLLSASWLWTERVLLPTEQRA